MREILSRNLLLPPQIVEVVLREFEILAHNLQSGQVCDG